MNDLYDVLEVCLQSLEHGASIDSLLEKHADYSAELRPLLEASLRARGISGGMPSAAGLRRGRARLLQKAAEMREQNVAPRRQAVIPLLQRLAIALGLTAGLLFGGTGLVSASSGALPGERLYPVKRTWEDLRLLLVLDVNERDALESQFEQERLREVNELLAEGRNETIRFPGVYLQRNGKDYVSGIPVLITAETVKPTALVNGAAVIVMGRTNADGIVVLDTIELLPPGSVVPMGEPVEAESGGEGDQSSGSGLQTGSDSSSGKDAGLGSKPESKHDEFKIEGTVESIAGNVVTVDGQTLYLDGLQEGSGIGTGMQVVVEGYYSPDGKFIVTKIDIKESGSGGDGGEDGSGSDSGSGSGSGSGGDSGSGGGDGSGSGGGDDGGSGGDDHSGSGG